MKIFFSIFNNKGEIINSLIYEVLLAIASGSCSTEFEQMYFEELKDGKIIPSKRLLQYIVLFSGCELDHETDEEVISLPTQNSCFYELDDPVGYDLSGLIHDLIDFEDLKGYLANPAVFTKNMFFGFTSESKTRITLKDVIASKDDQWYWFSIGDRGC